MPGYDLAYGQVSSFEAYIQECFNAEYLKSHTEEEVKKKDYPETDLHILFDNIYEKVISLQNRDDHNPGVPKGYL